MTDPLASLASRQASQNTPRTSVGSSVQRTASEHARTREVYTSVDRAQRAKQGSLGQGATTSVNRIGQSQRTTTSILRQDERDTTTSVYGRSRDGLDDGRDDKRYEYARRRIFQRKRREQKEQVKKVETEMKESGQKARSYMKKMVKEYSWKKPLGERFMKKERQAMKSRIDHAKQSKDFRDEDVDTMKELVDKIK